MRKWMCMLAGLLLASTLGMVSPANAANQTFTEDFASGDFSQWTNGHLDDDPETVDDDEVIGVAEIKDEMMHVNNKATGGSFFYIAPKDITAKNFTISMRAKSLDFTGSWIGFSVRKDTNDRYNGSNNVLHAFKFEESAISFQAYRGYPGGAGVVALTKNTTQSATFADKVDDWHTYKLVAEDNIFTAYVDDQVVGVVDYSNKKIDFAGYISINVCVGDVMIDDVSVEVQDDEAAAGGEPLSEQPADPADPDGANAGSGQEAAEGAGEASVDAPGEAEGAGEKPEASATEAPEATAEAAETSGSETSGAAEASGDDSAEKANSSSFPVWLGVILAAAVAAVGVLAYVKLKRK
ncbi:family 16 glycoside hydrolase [Paenibacillus agaridevorans]|uniref:family 16 glycoside hydrolase n=1 Tax=Paenibacillus agaridevorans TaxID=171404 RepID=UPI001BE40C5B|nr:family 16 glycoside hydrolase [Paenibacillus agaridevorans]